MDKNKDDQSPEITEWKGWEETPLPAFVDRNRELADLVEKMHKVNSKSEEQDALEEIVRLYEYDLDFDKHPDDAAKIRNYRLELELTEDAWKDLRANLHKVAPQDFLDPKPPLRVKEIDKGWPPKVKYFLHLNPIGGQVVGAEKEEGVEPRYFMGWIKKLENTNISPFYIARSARRTDDMLTYPQMIFNLHPEQVLGARIVLFKNSRNAVTPQPQAK